MQRTTRFKRGTSFVIAAFMAITMFVPANFALGAAAVYAADTVSCADITATADQIIAPVTATTSIASPVWSQTGLPNGMFIDQTTGVIKGIPYIKDAQAAAVQNFAATITAASQDGALTASAGINVTVNPADLMTWRQSGTPDNPHLPPLIWSANSIGASATTYSNVTSNVDFILNPANGLLDFKYAVLDGWVGPSSATSGATAYADVAGNGCAQVKIEGKIPDSITTDIFGNTIDHSRAVYGCYPIAPYRAWIESGVTYQSFADYCNSRGIVPGAYQNTDWLPNQISYGVAATSTNGYDYNAYDYYIPGTNPPIPVSHRLRAAAEAAGSPKFIPDQQNPRVANSGTGSNSLPAFQDWDFVNPNAVGAQEYIQGYINYFKSMGYKYIKQDFMRYTTYGYGRQGTAQVHKWMREAAGRDFAVEFCNENGTDINPAGQPINQLGQVIPGNNGYGYICANDAQYADSMRITNDTQGWNRISGSNPGRITMNSWPPVDTQFTAYNFFNYLVSDANGNYNPNAIILDGDYLKSANFTDREVETVVSLRILGNAGLQIGDNKPTNNGSNTGVQSDTATGAGGTVKAWSYKNADMIRLNKANFYAKPVKRFAYANNPTTSGSVTIGNTELYDPLAQTWFGRVGNTNEYILGMFNRTSTDTVTTVDFAKDLGLSGAYNARDLWYGVNPNAGTDAKTIAPGDPSLQNLTSYSETIQAHGCRILSLTPAALEQQLPPTGVSATNETINGAKNGTITGVDSTMEYSADNGATWKAVTGTTVTGLAPGAYLVRYAATPTAYASDSVSVTIAAGGTGGACTITFNANTGSTPGGGTGCLPANIATNAGVSVTLPNQLVTDYTPISSGVSNISTASYAKGTSGITTATLVPPMGKHFIGWSTDKDYANKLNQGIPETAALVANGGAFIPVTTGTVTLYAQFAFNDITPEQNAQFDTLLQSYDNYLLGVTQQSLSDPDAAKFVSDNDARINIYIGKYCADTLQPSNEKWVFTDMPISGVVNNSFTPQMGGKNGTGATQKNVSSDISMTYDRLKQMAMAYRTPGSMYYQSANMKAMILNAMKVMYQYQCFPSYYNPVSGTGQTNPADQAKALVGLGGHKAPFGNWYDWQIGISLRYLDLIELMRNDILADDTANGTAFYNDYVATCAYYCFDLSNNTYPGGGNGSNTGANRVWLYYNQSLIALLEKNPTRLDYLRNALNNTSPDTTAPGAFGYVTTGDGFYKDGSFIQHTNFAYTGGYGKAYVMVMSALMYMLKGSPYAISYPNNSEQSFYNAMFDSYEPLIYNGGFMDAAREREVSRFNGQDDISGREVLRALIYMTQVLPDPAQKLRLQSDLKYILQDPAIKSMVYSDPVDSSGIFFIEYIEQGSVLPIAQQILSDPSIPVGNPLYTHKTYASMDRILHRVPGFGMTVSMYSNRTLTYQQVNNEGWNRWHISDGTTYLYNSDPNRYRDNYYAAVDMQRLAGTTIQYANRLNAVQGAVSQIMGSGNTIGDENDSVANKADAQGDQWVGGTGDGSYGIAGFKLFSQYDPNSGSKTAANAVQAWKSYFMFDKEVVCLGSNISDGNANQTAANGNDVETILSNDLFKADNSNQVYVGVPADNIQVPTPVALGSAPTNFQNALWLNVQGNTDAGSNTGYYFPQPTTITGIQETRTGNWFNLNQYAKFCLDKPQTNNYGTFWISHGLNPSSASYQYVILPGMDAPATAAYAFNPNITVVQNDTNAAAVYNKAKKILGVNFWQANSTSVGDSTTIGSVTSDQKASVMLEDNGDHYDLYVADPTQKNRTITVTLGIPRAGAVTGDAGVSGQGGSSSATVTFNTTGQAGATMHASISKVGWTYYPVPGTGEQLSTLDVQAGDTPQTTMARSAISNSSGNIEGPQRQSNGLYNTYANVPDWTTNGSATAGGNFTTPGYDQAGNLVVNSLDPASFPMLWNPNVFAYSLHNYKDFDRSTTNYDRQRMEIKTDYQSAKAGPVEAYGGDIMTYHWKFFLPADLQAPPPAPHSQDRFDWFFHIFQIKAKNNLAGGSEASMPICTFTIANKADAVNPPTDTANDGVLMFRTSEIGAVNQDIKVVAQTDLGNVLGHWMEADVTYYCAHTGHVYVTLTDINDPYNPKTLMSAGETFDSFRTNEMQVLDANGQPVKGSVGNYTYNQVAKNPNIVTGDSGQIASGKWGLYRAYYGPDPATKGETGFTPFPSIPAELVPTFKEAHMDLADLYLLKRNSAAYVFPDGFKPSALTPMVFSYAKPAPKSVLGGTPFAALGLPAAAAATLNTGISVPAAAITWNAASYNPNLAGAQTITGSFDAYPASTVVPTITVTVTGTGHLVTFDSAGGTPVTPQSIMDGGKATEPTPPTKVGAAFAGWYLNGQPYDFSTPVTGDITLTAMWDAGPPIPPAMIDFEPDQGQVINTMPNYPNLAFREGAGAANTWGPASNTATKYALVTPDPNGAQGQILTLQTDTTDSGTALYAPFTFPVQSGAGNSFTTSFKFMYHGTLASAAWFEILSNQAVVSPGPIASLNIGGNTANRQQLCYRTGSSTTNNAVTNLAPDVWHNISVTVHFGAAVANGTYDITADGVTVSSIPFRSQGTIPDNNASCFRVQTGTGNTASTFYFDDVQIPGIYNVVFDSQGGTPVPTQLVFQNALVSKPANPAKDGYTFGGWYLPGAPDPFDFGSAVTQSMTLAASWIPNTCTVTFDSQGGSSVSPQTVDYGAAATKPANPSKPGYLFGGWLLNGAAYNWSAPVISDITLTASWYVDDTTNLAIGAGIKTSSQSGGSAALIIDGDTATQWQAHSSQQVYGFNNPTGTNYKLWAALDLHQPLTVSQVYIKFGNTTNRLLNLHVAYSNDGNSYNPLSNINTVTPGTTTPDPFASPGGWTDVWSTGNVVANQTAFTMPLTAPITARYWIMYGDVLYAATGAAIYTQEFQLMGSALYNVNYDANGGTGSVAAVKAQGGNTFTAAAAGALTPPAGKAFKQWNTAKDGSGAAYDPGAAVPMPHNDITLYAVWADAPVTTTYTVTFDAAGGAPTPADQTVEDGGFAKEPAPPTRDGYTFDGWFIPASDTAFDFLNNPINENIALTAQWTLIPPVTYTVTFDAAGGSPTPPAQTVTSGGMATRSDNPAKTGYTFDGWFASGSSIAYDFASPVTADLTLTAHWTLIPPVTYTVTFDAAGGSPTPPIQTVTSGGTATVPAAPTKADYTFAGWYLGGALYNFSAPVTADITLTAQWTPINGPVPPTSITMSAAQTSLNMKVSTKLSLQITVSPSNADPNVTWSSSNPAVATVDPVTGQVTAVKTGSVRITVKSNADPTVSYMFLVMINA